MTPSGLFFFPRRRSFTSLQMDLQAYFGERKRQGNVVVNRSERVLLSRWLRGHLKQLRGRAEGNCALCPTVTHRSLVATWSLFISMPVGQEHPLCTTTSTAAFGLCSESWSARSVAWSRFPGGAGQLSGTVQILQSWQLIHLRRTWHIKLSVIKRGIYRRRIVHTWCLSYLSSWPDAQMPGLVLWSHIRILLCGGKGKVCLEQELQEDEKDFLTACWGGCCTGVDAAGPNAIKAFLVDDKESRKVVINMHISVIDKLCCLLCAKVLHGQHLGISESAYRFRVQI